MGRYKITNKEKALSGAYLEFVKTSLKSLRNERKQELKLHMAITRDRRKRELSETEKHQLRLNIDSVKKLRTSRLEIQKLKEQLRRAKELTTIDSLTKLYNRGYFEARLHEEIDRSSREKQPFSLMMVDVDFFKKVNDTYGHLIGDAVLVHVAKIIKGSVRKSDVAARYGGEEFSVILPHTGPEEAMIVAERIRNNINSSHYIDKEKSIDLSISVSVGVKTKLEIPTFNNKEDQENRDVQEMANYIIDAADRSLYRAKETGRNKVVNYEEVKDGFELKHA